MAYNNKPNPDDRSDNVEKLQTMIDNTIENINKAEETLSFSNGEERARIEAKNERRKESIEGMRAEIKDESQARQNGYNENKTH
ncbi:small acid-soluble spore protein Tlp [Bacillus sp. FJAT-29790]|uniref:small acid-soluble spore protein Tlp n=1 Tax=Bacillus sp. FJAT-29790 TaxID=1895002 RepID=UPI001C248F9F|nr:small acid-soluble spore protein Tlp [Bacillus sp. FJAT-29790]MBU8878335.1 small acid-soluble spore protein Tlp [Bacillus sp. FJAT-29790]